MQLALLFAVLVSATGVGAYLQVPPVKGKFFYLEVGTLGEDHDQRYVNLTVQNKTFKMLISTEDPMTVVGTTKCSNCKTASLLSLPEGNLAKEAFSNYEMYLGRQFNTNNFDGSYANFETGIRAMQTFETLDARYYGITFSSAEFREKYDGLIGLLPSRKVTQEHFGDELSKAKIIDHQVYSFYTPINGKASIKFGSMDITGYTGTLSQIATTTDYSWSIMTKSVIIG